MKLNVLERVTLLGVLPEQGDFLTLRIVGQLRETLSFTEEEHEELQLKAENGRITWNPQADGDGKEIEIGARASIIISDKLKELNTKKELTPQHLSLYEKFIADNN